MGDFFFITSSTALGVEDNIQFWVIFFLILVMNNIIFLNFVIAEAGNSYNKVNDHIDEYIAQEKSALIDEAELMIPKFLRKDHWYPKYIVVRSFDN